MLKTNNLEMLRTVKTLVRQRNGLFANAASWDIISDSYFGGNAKEAWLVFAIEMVVKQGHPYKRTSTTGGLFVLRNTLL